jgi:hypothetical protein
LEEQKLFAMPLMRELRMANLKREDAKQGSAVLAPMKSWRLMRLNLLSHTGKTFKPANQSQPHPHRERASAATFDLDSKLLKKWVSWSAMM